MKMFVENVDWGTESPSTTLLHDALFSVDSPSGRSSFRKRKSRGKPSGNDDAISESFKRPTEKKAASTSSDKQSVSSDSLYRSRTKKMKFQAKLKKKMDGARFRWINEQLYTITGKEAKKMFEEDPMLFNVYHEGFTVQVSKWPVNPIDRVIAYIHELPPSLVVADFGCGEAKLAQSVPHQVFSFDLVACNRHVTVCDMANVPLEAKSVDVCVFCLSLMGTNVTDFIQEARRVLVKNGKLKICEILSRMSSIEAFVKGVESFGFKLIVKEKFSTMFVDLEFKAIPKKTTNKSQLILKPCNYKRR